MLRTEISHTKIFVIINNKKISLFFSMILIWRFDKLRVSWDQKSFLIEFIFLKLEKCMWMVKQGQTDIVLEVI